ncbi:MAG: hypothetical protein DMG14_25305 [Acidobacteria bacterium]|nr:MAG: hypothetical protein DMG14_25305 [Acidobacteriota bacterium]
MRRSVRTVYSEFGQDRAEQAIIPPSMSITIGTQLGPHEILGLLGKGGMGEVYRARDTKLKREVAIKILPDEFSRDGDRLSRFQREAEVLASLNHPNIAAIYELQEANDTCFLVLELVEGDTLADRLQQGPIPVEEALGIAKNISEALEAAHGKGIIHRDLKPANVKITPEGKVKVLDFGLAKAIETGPAGTTVSNSPTLLSGTMGGMILGTAAYMAPEQARGRAADQRSDVFSFGCVLYEMLTGHQLFGGEEVSDVLASVLKSEPNWNLLPDDLNPKLRDLLQRCLEKSPSRRWHAIADVRLEIESIIAEPRALKLQMPVTATPRPLWKRAIPILGAAVLAGIAGVAGWNLKRLPQPAEITRFSVAIPEGQTWPVRGAHHVAISPDGANIVYAANQQLYMRSMGEMEARPIPGTAQGADTPFFSPDGRWLGFYSSLERKLKKIAVSGGVAVTICDADNVFGASWDTHDSIFFGQGRNGIMRVSANGGKADTVVTLKPGELAHGPQVLPGGNALLFTLASSPSAVGWDKAQIVVQSLKTGERKVIYEGGSDARFVPTGHIVFALGSTVLALPFDAEKLQVTGGPVPVIEGVRRAPAGSTGAVQFAVSNNGSLVYVPGDRVAFSSQVTLALIDRAGSRKPLNIEAGMYAQPRISPDGKFLALHTDDGKERIVWIYDLSGRVPIRKLTFGGLNAHRPTWTLDSQRVVFTSDREGDPGLYWQRADGSGVPELIVTPEPGTTLQSEAFSADGKVLIFSFSRGGDRNLAMASLGLDRKPKPLIKGYASNSSISHDGSWLAYSANESGRNEIYVQPFPPTGAKYQVSFGGGRSPLWSPDGRQLFYLQGQANGTQQIVSVDVQTQPAFVAGKTAPLPIEGVIADTGPRSYDISPDGKFFVVMLPQAQANDKAPPEQVNVALNWFDELKQRVPVR